MAKLELTEEIRELYTSSARGVEMVDVPLFNFIMIDGQLEDGTNRTTSDSFQDALNALNGISFTLKFISKLNRKNPIDYNTMPLEGLWHPSGKNDFKNRSGWKWTLMMMQPEHISTDMFEDAVSSLRKKRSGISALKLARFEPFHEGSAVQIMHVSSPGLVPMTIERIKNYARKEKYQLGEPYHEIYLSDPRHTKPEKQRTILRYPIKIISGSKKEGK